MVGVVTRLECMLTGFVPTHRRTCTCHMLELLTQLLRPAKFQLCLLDSFRCCLQRSRHCPAAGGTRHAWHLQRAYGARSECLLNMQVFKASCACVHIYIYTCICMRACVFASCDENLPQAGLRMVVTDSGMLGGKCPSSNARTVVAEA